MLGSTDPNFNFNLHILFDSLKSNEPDRKQVVKNFMQVYKKINSVRDDFYNIYENYLYYDHSEKQVEEALITWVKNL